MAKGYLLPAVEGWCVADSTYAHGATESRITAAGQAGQYRQGRRPARPRPAACRNAPRRQVAAPGWAGWRAVLPGRLPAIGPGGAMRDGVYLATGYASRGLSWASLAGDIIAAHLCGEPAVLESERCASVAPR